MKKVLFILMLGAIALISCNSEKKFDTNLQEAYSKMLVSMTTSAYVCDDISSTWRNAIYDHKGPDGKYCSDFNDALRELRKGYMRVGITDSLTKYRDEMQSLTSKLNNPPTSRKDCYDDFVALVSEVSSLSRMATDPTGSLQSYNNDTNDTMVRIKKMIDQFNIKYAEFLKKK